MINRDYLDAGSILADSAKMRLDSNVSNEEKEINKLYHYCLSRLTWEIYSSSVPLKSYAVELEQHYHGDKVLHHGTISEYSPTFVTDDEFCAVIQKVADIFNDKSMVNYRAICDTNPETMFLIVFLENFSE